jgi:hypothetical protein
VKAVVGEIILATALRATADILELLGQTWTFR